MLDFARTSAFWKVASALFFAASLTLLLTGCASALPAFQSDLEDIRTDQNMAMESAAEGDWIRASISGLLALAGSVTYAIGAKKKYDKAPFEGEVGGEKMLVTEDEIVKAVALAKRDGKIV